MSVSINIRPGHITQIAKINTGAPTIDERNPFYCPTVPAVEYLDSLRRDLRTSVGDGNKSANTSFHRLSDDPDFPSFASLLDRSITDDDLIQLVYGSGMPANRRLSDSSSYSVNSILSAPSWEKNRNRHRYNIVQNSPSTYSSKKTLVSTASSDNFSALKGPLRRGLSSASVSQGSFVLSGKAQRLRYRDFLPRSKIASQTSSDFGMQRRHTHKHLYGPQIGTETPRGIKAFIERLDSVLPGIRLKEKLYTLDALSHQRIVDTLAMDGKLNTRVLNLLRMSEIEIIDLSPSMTDEDGLNLDSQELLQVFAKPNSFLFLREVNLNGTQLDDASLLNIHHLPRLSRLWISNTGITNEGVYLLVSLKRSLTELDIAFNASIDNDVVPALLILYKLRFISILGTNVEMSGLRKFAAKLYERNHTIDMEIPRPCEIYVDKMSKKYIIQPDPPLITDPDHTDLLSTSALKKNLAAHAHINSEIAIEGSKTEMRARLKELLELRKADLLVRAMLWKDDEGSGDSEVF
ncbi:hypothetical protein C8Q75DRAFT_732327 [Abortiporus biennis]|nr:hypothetical protein C8Q75DRAFT_732327 [Abortiporus biennis]